ncbi:MAG TPA: DNA polymerase Y family protein [Candidatus Baltobacteraceae bacterium]|jgi:protein ImuB|nr:DNA polymerase Y family protein [Candidatus Baltobacteraceae bacterium]
MFAVIYIPDFELQAALRLEPELHSLPVALLDDAPVKAAVLQLTGPAREAGVCRGQTSTQAMARCSDLVLKTRSRAREETVTAMLLQCAYGFSPTIEATAQGVCTLDLMGLPAALDPQNWAKNILDALEQLQLQAQIGVAETPHLAWLGAKQARPFLLAQDAEPFVAALPLEFLEPAADILEILEMWGIRTVGAFLALGKENIAQRFGPEAVDLFDLASSRRVRPLNRVVPAEIFEEAMEFEPPVESLQPLLFVLRRFVEQLARRLELLYLVVADLQLRLDLASGEAYERQFVIPAPTRDVETLFRALQTHLENVRTDSPICSLRLGARPGRAANYQFVLFNAALRDPAQFHQTLARLTALLGSHRVGTPRLVETHRPDSFRMDLEGITTPRDQEPCAAQNQEPSIGPALRRFRPPLPATVEMRAEKPALLRSPAFTGPIAAVRGPWRLSGHWWDREAWTRDEWDVQTHHGELLRLARQEEEWFVDGIFD